MPIRVLTISKPYVAAAYRNKLEEMQRQGGTDVGLICPNAWGSQGFEQNASPVTIWMRTLPITFNGKNHFHFYRGLGQAIDEFRPDLLNIEEEHYSVVTMQAVWQARLRRIPAIFYTWQNIDKKYPPPFHQMEQYVFRSCAGAVAGNAEAEEILRRKGYRGEIRVIPQMGVELAWFAPPAEASRAAAKQAVGLDPNAFWLSFFGRLVPEKGVQDILAALSQLPDENIRLLIVGDGPHRAELMGQVTALNLSARVRFEQNIPSRAVASYLQAVDVLCLPSHTRPNWKEQFGRVLIEAMAAEAVPLGSSSGEIPNVIGCADLIFKERDPGDLAARIHALRNSPELVQKLREQGRVRVRKHFTNEVIASRFTRFFAEIHSKALRAEDRL